jgi:hypothetical protein
MGRGLGKASSWGKGGKGGNPCKGGADAKPRTCNNCLFELNGRRAFDFCKKCKMEWRYKSPGVGPASEHGPIPDSWKRGFQSNPTKGGTTKGSKEGKGNAPGPGADRAPQRPGPGRAAAARAGTATDFTYEEEDAALHSDAEQDGGEQGEADGGTDDE